MIQLFTVAIVTSSLDSLNPIAITQQFILQNLVQKKKNIWGFIIGMGGMNFLAGVFVYYGLATFFSRVLKGIMEKYGYIFPFMYLLIGGGLLLFSIKKYIKRKTVSNETVEIEEVKIIGKSFSFGGLFLIGVLFCGMELTSAFPYFGFIAILIQYQLSIGMLLIILIIYNMIYSLPLIAMYICYSLFEEKLDTFYKLFNRFMQAIIQKVIPIVVIVIGSFFVYMGITGILL